MTGRIARWLALVAVVVCITFLVVRHRRVLDSQELDSAIKEQLPVGSSKTVVIHFIKKRHPQFYDDYGTEVKARISGLAGNMIYTKDVVLSFEFDSNGRLLSHSKQETMTFF
jgi:hypothetical protein